jgi:hypothetical protein
MINYRARCSIAARCAIPGRFQTRHTVGKLFLVGSVLSLASPYVGAAPLPIPICEHVVPAKGPPPKISSGVKTPPEQAAAATAVIDRMYARLKGAFLFPGDVQIDALENCIGPCANLKSNTIRIEFLLRGEQKELSPEAVGMLAHEFAHVVFNESRALFSPEWKEYLDKKNAHYAEFRALEQSLQTRLMDLEASLWEIVSSGNLDAAPAISAERMKVQNELASLNQKVSASRRPNAAMDSMPYQEVFCDLAAYIETGDPAIISKSVTHDPHGFRDFSGPERKEDWEQTEVHDLFTPVRRFLWKTYLSKPEYRGREVDVLEAVYGAAMKLLEPRVYGGGKSGALSRSRDPRIAQIEDFIAEIEYRMH